MAFGVLVRWQARHFGPVPPTPKRQICRSGEVRTSRFRFGSERERERQKDPAINSAGPIMGQSPRSKQKDEYMKA